MNKSDSINELAGALAKAQGAFTAAEREHIAKVVSKKGEGSSYSYAYADLASYLSVCRKPLAENGLAFIQSPKVNGAMVTVTTLLVHSSGQFWESDPLEMAAADSGPQTIGSILTYCRRYSLAACIGMASEADDDAVSGSGFQGETGRKEPKPSCPDCGTNKHVYEDRQKGGFFCWKAKGGCGANWLPGDEQPPDDAPKTNGKKKTDVQKLADEHGMKTGDQLARPVYRKALDSISRAVAARHTEGIAAIVNAAENNTGSEKLTDNEQKSILHECTLALRKIKALETEPVNV